MKIQHVDTWVASLELVRPYTIAFTTIDSVQNVFVRIITDDGHVGIGSGAPFAMLTGESAETALEVLSEQNLGWMVGADPRELQQLCRTAGDRLSDTPAARAAVDIALYDLFARMLGVPLSRFLGQVHNALPTSVTIGIMPTHQALELVDEYKSSGFSILKVKIGADVEEDVERLRKIRERAGPEMRIRCDANQGYTPSQFLAVYEAITDIGIELFEQPFPAPDIGAMRALPETIRAATAADESLLREQDALSLAAPERVCGVFNIKLMKCGGITPARRIAAVAELADIGLMWGCMDESVVSISAALHTAFASPATRYLDLDGSFDLASDLAEGGFTVEHGFMRIIDAPGLGVTLLEDAGRSMPARVRGS